MSELIRICQATRPAIDKFEPKDLERLVDKRVGKLS